ncbi:hypothetical protein AB0I28_28755 [Phytomonospora sp. NPDC050363]|uniref:hypothetical protein n=1 Tax=Phytomonospora sp. NPDC050363 TaxID=3155642 RepID=UPI0033C35F23
MRPNRSARKKRITRYLTVSAISAAALAVAAGIALPLLSGTPAEASDPVAAAEQALDLEGRLYGVALRLEHECMEARGFTDHPDDVDHADYLLVPTLDDASQYGFVNAEEATEASAFTSKPLVYQEAYLLAFAGDKDWERMSGVPPTAGTCLAEVNERLYGNRIAPARPGAFDAANQEALLSEDPALDAAYETWRACLRGKGDYPDFATVDQARKFAEKYYEDERDYAEARRKELALAVDVSTCASGSGLREAYKAARDTARATLYAHFLPQIQEWTKTIAAALAVTGTEADD